MFLYINLAKKPDNVNIIQSKIIYQNLYQK